MAIDFWCVFKAEVVRDDVVLGSDTYSTACVRVLPPIRAQGGGQDMFVFINLSKQERGKRAVPWVIKVFPNYMWECGAWSGNMDSPAPYLSSSAEAERKYGPMMHAFQAWGQALEREEDHQARGQDRTCHQCPQTTKHGGFGSGKFTDLWFCQSCWNLWNDDENP